MSQKLPTRAIHSSYKPEEHNGALMPPIYQNSMFLLHYIEEGVAYSYSRVGNPTRTILEDTIADLEEGIAGFAFASGIAAIDAIWRTILRPGDTILAVSDIYGGSYELLTSVYRDNGIKTVFEDLTDSDHLEEIFARHKDAQFAWLETPSNPLLKLVDIKKIVALAKKYDMLVGADNTFATPCLQTPLSLGVDVIAHSATKYLGGHSDVTLGLVACGNPTLAKKIKHLQYITGGIAGPMDCAITLRGIKTLPLRFKEHQKNAAIIAERLSKHPKISQVYYPGLTSHPHHQLAQQQMRGFGGVVSIRLKNDSREAANTLIKNLKIFKLSASLGGVESLLNHSASQSHGNLSQQEKEKRGISEGLLRLSIGIEDVEDIWYDLESALQQVK